MLAAADHPTEPPRRPTSASGRRDGAPASTPLRLARGGNRQLNAALHRVAVTQIRLDSLGRVYYQRRREGGDTTMEALRALKHRLARIVFNLLEHQQPAPPDLLPAAA